ncbi:MAG TPA: methylmalonyl-CoA mutase family protein, partial [Dehalococcoidales bacterium]|nr:methylmalonyl-CoA mutase family protein [Dehalococcoidales bacterium]
MSKSKQEWKQKTLQPMVAKNPEGHKFETSTGMEVDTVYTPEDLPGFNYDNDLGYPGEYPYTRGVQANMYRGRAWTMRQYAGFGTAPESNKRFRWLLEHGQTGLSVA